MKNLLFFVSVLILLVSCSGEVDHYYVPDNQKPLLKDKDTLFYLDSAHNKINAFRISVRSYFNASDHSAYQHFEIDYIILTKYSSFKYLITNQSENFKIIAVNDQYYFENNESILTNFNLHGVVYPKVFVDYEKYFPDTIPCVVYYTYQDGILRYDYKDGRHYDRIKK